MQHEVREQVAIVHAVEVVTGEDQHEVAADLLEHPLVLSHRVGGALEPGAVALGLLGGEDLDIARGEGVETVGPADVTVQGHRVELGQNVHPLHVRVDGVGDGDVDQSVLARDRHRGLAAMHGQGVQPGASTTAENQYRNILCEIFDSGHGQHLTRDYRRV